MGFHVISKFFAKLMIKSNIPENICSNQLGSRSYSSKYAFREKGHKKKRNSSFQDHGHNSEFGRRRSSPTNEQEGSKINREQYEMVGYYNNYEPYEYYKRTKSHKSSKIFREDQTGYGHGNFQSRDKTFHIDIPPIKWETVDLKPFKKNIYIEPNIVKNQSASEIIDFRNRNEIVVNGDDQNLNPILKFSHYSFPDPLQKSLELMKFDTPMPIQSVTWPLVLSGNDLIGIGQTGSGKTLGFALPAIAHCLQLENSDGSNVVVLAPARELVQQIYDVFMSLGKFSGVTPVCVYGGASKMVQCAQLQKKPMVIIATPGRLMDLMSQQIVNLQNCTYLVLDEADRMLDMGFGPQIRNIAKQIRADRQTLMWSATWPSDVIQLAKSFTRNAIHVSIGSKDICANTNIKQEILFCTYSQKLSMLKAVLNKSENEAYKILIFVATKNHTDQINRLLNSGTGVKSAALHGDLPQSSRNQVIKGFKGGHIRVVVATDVASRGLDVSDIGLVINFDLPNNIDSYIHRIGRTARAGKKGRSLSFFTEEDYSMASKLTIILRKNGQEVPKELQKYANHMNNC